MQLRTGKLDKETRNQKIIDTCNLVLGQICYEELPYSEYRKLLHKASSSFDIACLQLDIDSILVGTDSIKYIRVKRRTSKQDKSTVLMKKYPREAKINAIIEEMDTHIERKLGYDLNAKKRGWTRDYT